MAEERTFSAWIRTSLASMALGFGVARLLAELEPMWLVTSLGAFLILLGVLALGFGFESYRRSLRLLDLAGDAFVPVWLAAAFVSLYALAGAAGIVLVVIG